MPSCRLDLIVSSDLEKYEESLYGTANHNGSVMGLSIAKWKIGYLKRMNAMVNRTTSQGSTLPFNFRQPEFCPVPVSTVPEGAVPRE